MLSSRDWMRVHEASFVLHEGDIVPGVPQFRPRLWLRSKYLGAVHSGSLDAIPFVWPFSALAIQEASGPVLLPATDTSSRLPAVQG